MAWRKGCHDMRVSPRIHDDLLPGGTAQSIGHACPETPIWDTERAARNYGQQANGRPHPSQAHRRAPASRRCTDVAQRRYCPLVPDGSA